MLKCFREFGERGLIAITASSVADTNKWAKAMEGWMAEMEPPMEPEQAGTGQVRHYILA